MPRSSGRQVAQSPKRRRTGSRNPRAETEQAVLSGPENETQPKVEGPRLGKDQQKTQFVETLERVRDATTGAVEAAHVPRPYQGKITLLRAKSRMIEPYEDITLAGQPSLKRGWIAGFSKVTMTPSPMALSSVPPSSVLSQAQATCSGTTSTRPELAGEMVS